ncbi:MAG: fumarylacetoacetase [Bacteriovoracaceae bacterium]|nr:fumarylacetoacetase [Bacteriovoracaceae bacterium]
MKFATVKYQNEACLAISFQGNAKEFILWRDYVKQFPNDKVITQTLNFLDFIKRSEILIPHLKKNEEALLALPKHSFENADFLMPYRPEVYRDFYCFEQHAKTMRKGRGLEMIPEWYQDPVFHYGNPTSFGGPVDVVAYPKDCQKLDLELEIACVIGKEIRNATLETARKAIFGYTLMNDWSARDFQDFDMKLNMGPTKGKDFATTFGSYVITADELESKRSGKGYDIEVEALINGERLVKNNWSTIYYSFEEMIVRASKNCTIYPGELIGSGTIGWGSLREHHIEKGLSNWLKIGDTVALNWLPEGPTISNRIGNPV